MNLLNLFQKSARAENAGDSFVNRIHRGAGNLKMEHVSEYSGERDHIFEHPTPPKAAANLANYLRGFGHNARAESYRDETDGKVYHSVRVKPMGGDKTHYVHIGAPGKWSTHGGFTKSIDLFCKGVEQTKYKYSSTQVNVESPVSDEIAEWVNTNIPEEILTADGRETEFHITVKYGIHTNDPIPLAMLLRDYKTPITARLGKFAAFNTNLDFDVLFVEVDSPDLHELNKLVANYYAHTDTHPVYKPHLTLAYLKKGEAEKFVGQTPFSGRVLEFDAIMFSKNTGGMEPIRFGWRKFAETPLEKACASGFPLDGRRKWQGIDVSVENRAGSWREDKHNSPPKWKTKMLCDYGYLRGTEGTDGDHLDVFFGHDPNAQNVYIVNQVKPGTGEFDEQKVMLDFPDEASAKAMYLGHYDTPEFFGSMQTMPVEEFKRKALATLHGKKMVKSLDLFSESASSVTRKATRRMSDVMWGKDKNYV